MQSIETANRVHQKVLTLIRKVDERKPPVPTQQRSDWLLTVQTLSSTRRATLPPTPRGAGPGTMPRLDTLLALHSVHDGSKCASQVPPPGVLCFPSSVPPRRLLAFILLTSNGIRVGYLRPTRAAGAARAVRGALASLGRWRVNIALWRFTPGTPPVAGVPRVVFARHVDR
jgi:hypothetical protein